MAEAFALALTPHGRLHADPAPPDESVLAGDLASTLTSAFGRGPGQGLLELGGVDPSTAVPASVGWARELSHLFFSQLCAVADLDARREKLELPPPAESLGELASRPPPMTGAEYLSTAVLSALWNDLLTAFREEIRAYTGPAEQWLHEKNPIWNVVGRVCFHLAENKNDPKRPFGFLATYAVGFAAGGRVQYRPLGAALQEYAGAGKKEGLLTLLLPVERAAEKSAFIKELVEQKRIFQPQAWTANEAHRFLLSLAACESAGVVVRVPDWWKRRSPPRVGVQVSVGGRTPSAVGVAALVDFKVGLAVDGEPVTAEEWARLRSATAGLVQLRGKWVEVDPEKLDQILAHWEDAKSAHRNGIAFHEAMRMLSGVQLNGDSPAPAAEAAELVRVVAGPWLASTLGTLRQAETAAPVHPGAALRATLRPYQELGVRWLWYLNQLNLGGCLADDMGLGKTIQVLSLFLLTRNRQRSGPHLLVVPATLLANWQAEAARFTPDLRLFVAHPSAVLSAELSKGLPPEGEKADVVMTTYSSLHRYEWLREKAWDTVVLDEAQAIKNNGARQTQAAKALKSRVRLALTGTPIENRLGDLWSLFDFLNSGLLGTSKEFGRFLKSSQERGGMAPLRALVQPYMLRRLKTDKRIIADLPDKTEVRAFCSLTKAQAALYQQVVEHLKTEIETVEGIQRRGVVLATLMKLKQICNHPSQFSADNGWETDRSGKIDRLREIVEEIASRQEKVLVFSQFREITEPLARWLGGMFGRPGLVLHGDTPLKERRARVERFQEDEEIPFMVLSVKAGGTGLTLTAANHVIHFDRWWNPAVENQATDRAFRIGQKKNVVVHKFICRGTVEERIDEMIESKKKLSTDVLEGGGELLLTELDDRELLRVVSLDVKRAVSDA
jgi:non-specific serine/threonine protein kinase